MRSTNQRVSHVAWRWVWLCLSVIVIGGCEDSPTGPSLSAVTVNDVGLRPTTDNAELCCCRVTGKSVNQNTVPVHVTITFAALDDREDELSRIRYFIEDFQPSATHRIDAAGFLLPCSAIDDVGMTIDVRGIEFPPFR
jgi:hypothetical protein